MFVAGFVTAAPRSHPPLPSDPQNNQKRNNLWELNEALPGRPSQHGLRLSCKSLLYLDMCWDLVRSSDTASALPSQNRHRPSCLHERDSTGCERGFIETWNLLFTNPVLNKARIQMCSLFRNKKLTPFGVKGTALQGCRLQGCGRTGRLSERPCGLEPAAPWRPRPCRRAAARGRRRAP